MGEPALRGEREGRPGAGLASVLREPGTKSLGGVGVLTQKVLVQVEGEPRVGALAAALQKGSRGHLHRI